MQNFMQKSLFLGDSKRSSRNKKGDYMPSKCEECEVTFPSKKELVLHNSKKCKSHQCPKCQKFYANERTLKNHSCEEPIVKEDIADTSRVDQDIKVIKLDKTKINHLVSTYSKSSIRSRPCIILNPKFPTLVLEVFQKV